MLPDVSHEPGFIPETEVVLSDKDREILRKLASEQAEIAALPVHREKAELWRDLNDLKSKRPMVWFTEFPWHELNVDNELTIQTEHPFARDQEAQLRKLLYQWHHIPGDMIVDDFLPCPLVIQSTGFGINENVDIVKTDEGNNIVSREFHIQIEDFDDLEKIKMPKVTLNKLATDLRYQAMSDLYEGILPVQKIGKKNIWFTPWDFLIRWWGIEEALMDMIDQPDLVHAAVERMVDAWMIELDQFDSMNLLSIDANNTRIGSGGYGYSSDLPGKDFDPDHVHPHNMWGCSNAQIFAEVSPDFHWEFAVEHDLRWLERFGLNYYGCCEQLHHKIDVIRRIPNLRKISCSPRCEAVPAVENIGSDYVMSRKPNPAIFAEDSWNPDRARKEMDDWMRATDGQCHVEFIFKDLSTVRYDPKRLWDMEKIAMEVVDKYAS